MSLRDRQRMRRQRDAYEVLPDGEHEYRGDDYYGWDSSTEPQPKPGWEKDFPAIEAQVPDQSTQEP